jgi:hypothetical protein
MAKAALSLVEQSRLVELEAVVERGLQTFVDVGLALTEIRDGRLYRETHATFEEYLERRWEMARRTAYKYIEAAGVALNVPTSAQLGLSQAAELASLPPEEQREVAGAIEGLTVLEVRQAVREFKAWHNEDGEQLAETLSDVQELVGRTCLEILTGEDLSWPGSPYARMVREHLAKGEAADGTPLSCHDDDERELLTSLLGHCMKGAECDYEAAVCLWTAGRCLLEIERRHRDENDEPLSPPALCKLAAEVSGHDLAEVEGDRPERMHAGIRIARAWPTPPGLQLAIKAHEPNADPMGLWRYLAAVAEFEETAAA